MTLPPIRPSHRPSGRAPRSAEAGIGKPGGLLVAAITAALVFALGQRVWPRHQPDVPAAPAFPPTTAPAAVPPPADAAAARSDGAPAAAPGADAATTGSAPNGGAAGGDARRTSSDAGEAAPRSATESTKPAKVAPAPGGGAAKAEAAPTRKGPEGDQEERPADKDVARQAWRSNRPDVSTDGNKSSILIPLKGSIAGAGFRVSNKPHAVIVTLPRAASLITMRVYRVNRGGFRLLWINQAEKDPDPKDGSSLKLGLSDLGDPLVEIKDDFVRVTVHRQAVGPSAPANRAAKAGAAHD
ncbi:MAG TPA: hypothetical protein VFG23_21575, partial [Polyangia bacterium]|nr:hypothetical protein [Polyangia bacterium]